MWHAPDCFLSKDSCPIYIVQWSVTREGRGQGYTQLELIKSGPKNYEHKKPNILCDFSKYFFKVFSGIYFLFNLVCKWYHHLDGGGVLGSEVKKEWIFELDFIVCFFFFSLILLPNFVGLWHKTRFSASTVFAGF